MHDPTHLGFAMTPLFQSFLIPSIRKALTNVARAADRPDDQSEIRIYHGYAYESVKTPSQSPDADRPPESLPPSFQNIPAKFDRIVKVDLGPLYEELDQWPARIQDRWEASLALTRLIAVYDQVWTLHMEIVMEVFRAQEFYESVFLECFPEKSSLDAHALLNGASNQFVKTDQALAQLADSVRHDNAIVRALMAEDALAAIRDLPEAAKFLEQLTELMDRYGWRVGGGHDFYHPSWREDPTPALAIIRQMLESHRSLEAEWHEVVQVQQHALNETLAQLSPSNRSRFEKAFAIAWAARPLDEDHHFYIDAMLPAKSRPILLKIAEVLIRDGKLKDSADLFFLYRDELEEMLAGHSPIAVKTLDTRQSLYEDYVKETPPPRLGPTADHKNPAHDPAVIKGIGASAGIFRGVVHIVQGPQDFSRFKAGEVLVARTTTPIWSGLFASAGAVVTDAGGILSHAATVAREYGVPCVVATRVATRELHDREVVIIDGTKGTVTRV